MSRTDTATDTTSPSRLPRFLDLPLFWKLLVPFATLLLIVGAFGTFVITRELTARARSTLNEDLLQLSLEARTRVQARELDLLEAINLAANLDGMAEAVQADDDEVVADLLASVLALKNELDLLVATRSDGTAVVEYARPNVDADPQREPSSAWIAQPIVAEVLAGSGEGRRAGIIEHGGQRLLAVAGPICLRLQECESVGAAVVGVDLQRVVTVDEDVDGSPGFTLFDSDGTVLAASGMSPNQRVDVDLAAGDLRRRTEHVDGVEVHTLYAPLTLQGRSVGLIGVSLPTEPVFGAVRGAAVRLALLLLAALVGIVGIGALLARVILRQVIPLVETNRKLGQGDLTARAAVVSRDEIGEVARGLNQMADQLQASYETLESRVSQRTEEVERLLMERTEFFASLSHELRTPLAVILTEAALLPDGSKRDVRESSRTIEESASQLIDVVNGILDVAEAEAGSLELDLTPTDLSTVVDDLRRTVTGLARGANVTADIEVPDDLPQVLADAVRLREILLNLIDNAVKYSPDGGHVEVSARRVDDEVHVTVSDTGPGIPAEIGDRVFQPFFRVKGIEARAGRSTSGLGLALTRKLVEAHGGTIDFDSTPGEGTAFTFTLQAVARRRRAVSTRGLSMIAAG